MDICEIQGKFGAFVDNSGYLSVFQRPGVTLSTDNRIIDKEATTQGEEGEDKGRGGGVGEVEDGEEGVGEVVVGGINFDLFISETFILLVLTS